MPFRNLRLRYFLRITLIICFQPRRSASALSQRQPIFNVPGIVLELLVTFCAVHLLLWVVLPTEEGEWLMLALAFIPARMGALAGDLPGGHVATYTSFVTHQFVHGNLAHLGINSAWLLAFFSASR